jgi:hypothetical protein
MVIHMLCPNGHELVTVDQDAGRTILCPHCQLVVIVPAAPTAITSQPALPESQPRQAPGEIDVSPLEEEDLPLPEAGEQERRPRRGPDGNDDDEEEDRPRKKKKKKKGFPSRRQLAMISRGLGFHYAKLLTYMIALPVLIGCNLAVTFVFASSGRDMVAFFGLVGMAAFVWFGFVSPALGIAGSTLCCWLPSRTGGRPLLIASLVLDVTTWIFPLVSILGAEASPAFRGFGTTMATAVLALGLSTTAFLWTGVSFIVFILYLRKLAQVLADVGMANEARQVIAHYILLLIAAPLLAGIAIYLMHYLSKDYASAYDFANAVFAPQVEAVESREWVIGCSFAIALGIWLVFVIKLLARMLALIGSVRHLLRARFGV